MATLVDDCPRCGANRITFDVRAESALVGTSYKWQHHYEVFAVCRHCGTSTIFQISDRDLETNRKGGAALIRSDGNLNDWFKVDGFINVKDIGAEEPPEHLPDDVATAFREGAASMAIQSWNAAGAMFRAAIDLATRSLLPPAPQEGQDDAPGLNRRVRRDLGLRLPWLFEHGLLPDDLQELSTCIREDGNDAAHMVNLGKDELDDLVDFTRALLERRYTVPGRLAEAAERRQARRAPRPEE